MEIRVRLRRLRHLTSIVRQKKIALKQTLKNALRTIAAAAHPLPEPNLELGPEPEAGISQECHHEQELETAQQQKHLVFHRFNDLPNELRFKIWKHVAESTTQVVHIAPYTAGRLRRHFKFYGHYCSLTPFPPFLQVNHELRIEGLRYYSNLVEDSKDFKHRIPFNFNRDVLLISLQLSYAKVMQQSIRSILPLTTWHKIQNVCFQVRDWEMYPWHLDLLNELPKLKELHFTSFDSKEYRHNIDHALDSHVTEWWTVQDCSGMLGRDMYGDVDYAGVDDTDDIDQRQFQFYPLKLEFEYARHYDLPNVSIKLPCWSPFKAFMSTRTGVNTNGRNFDQSAESNLASLGDD